MGWIISFILSLLLSPAFAAKKCESLLQHSDLIAVKELIDNSKRDAYLITVDDDRGLVIVVSNYRPQYGSRLEALLNEIEAEYDVLRFHGSTAYHILNK